MTWEEWIEDRRWQKPAVKARFYSEEIGNKKVRVHAEGSRVIVEWYLNGEKLDEPEFPPEQIQEIAKFAESLKFKVINDQLLSDLAFFLRGYLVYLKDPNEGPLKYVKINGSVSL